MNLDTTRKEPLGEHVGVRCREVVPGAGHLFEGEGELEEVAGLARDWFVDHLGTGRPAGRQ